MATEGAAMPLNTMLRCCRRWLLIDTLSAFADADVFFFQSYYCFSPLPLRRFSFTITRHDTPCFLSL